MKIVGMIGAVIGFIVCLLLLSFILTAIVLSGRIDDDEKK